jgi:hypothetical protein
MAPLIWSISNSVSTPDLPSMISILAPDCIFLYRSSIVILGTRSVGDGFALGAGVAEAVVSAGAVELVDTVAAGEVHAGIRKSSPIAASPENKNRFIG